MSGDLFEALWVYATFGCWHERTDDFVWKWDCKLKNGVWKKKVQKKIVHVGTVFKTK